MASSIHPTAIVHPGAKLGDGTSIGPFGIIGPNVVIEDGVRTGVNVQIGAFHEDVDSRDDAVGVAIQVGEGTIISSNAVLSGGSIVIGKNNSIGHGVVLYGDLETGASTRIFDLSVVGAAGQYPDRELSTGKVEIGANVTIREHGLVHKPVLTPSTKIGDGCYLMSRAQIDHDCRLAKNIKLACGVTLGGSVTIDDNAYLGMNAVVHQRVRIGRDAMVGMNSAVMKNVPPYAVLVDRVFTKINRVGLAIQNIPESDVDAIDDYYRTLSASGAVKNSSHYALKAIADFYRDSAGSAVFTPDFGRKRRKTQR